MTFITLYIFVDMIMSSSGWLDFLHVDQTNITAHSRRTIASRSCALRRTVGTKSSDASYGVYRHRRFTAGASFHVCICWYRNVRGPVYGFANKVVGRFGNSNRAHEFDAAGFYVFASRFKSGGKSNGLTINYRRPVYKCIYSFVYGYNSIRTRRFRLKPHYRISAAWRVAKSSLRTAFSTSNAFD